MKKSILVSILILLSIALGIFLITRKPAEAPIQSVSIEDNDSQTIAEGNYALNTSESILRAQGQKPLISGYTDTSKVSFKEGSITIAGDKITGNFTVDMASISVESTGKGGGESMLEKHLKSPDFFDVEKYPESVFMIKSAEKSAGNNLYIVTGDLTTHGITASVTFPAMIYMDNDQLKAEGLIKLDRTLWSIKYGSGSFFSDLGDKVIGDIFTIEFKITADAK